MNLLLFTDTLGDVNGVSRFIRNVADLALTTNRQLTVFCSTRFDVPHQSNIRNFAPIFAPQMPGYENLELAIPPARAMLREARRLKPDMIHVSTPGPVGCIGFLAAKLLKVPLAGVYHTDFPAYVENLFRDPSLTWLCESFMRAFYRRFRIIFTRSIDYAHSLERLGIQPDRLVPLRAGIRVEDFRPELRDLGVWGRVPTFERAPISAGLWPPQSGVTPDVSCIAAVPPDAASQATRNPGQGRVPTTTSPIRLLYVGRVSIEKNLPLLSKVWSKADALLREKNKSAELIIIGDGPYRAEMESNLAASGARARFLGFRYGPELATFYASSDLFVFPSITDTLGQVVMESQSAGLPVLVTDQGGPKEVVKHGETGLVLRHTHPDEWVDAIVRLVSDADTRARMGRAAHDFMQRFSIRASFDHYWETHERACEQPDPARSPRLSEHELQWGSRAT
jgi:glycosyltransferase involved in cell wall biosynthesis